MAAIVSSIIRFNIGMPGMDKFLLIVAVDGRSDGQNKFQVMEEFAREGSSLGGATTIMTSRDETGEGSSHGRRVSCVFDGFFPVTWRA